MIIKKDAIMKKLLFPLALVAASSFIISSCEREMEVSEKVDSGLSELHFHVKAHQDPETRTYLQDNGDGSYTPKWKSGDQLGAFLSGTTISGSTTAVDMTLTNGAADGATGDFEGTAVADGSGTFQAFYPVGAFETGYADGTIGLNIGTPSDYIQHPSLTSPDPSCDILVSKACDYISDGVDVVIDDLLMARLFSVLKINLKGSYAATEEVSWLKIEASSGTLSGRAKVNLSTPEITSWTVAKKYAWAEYSSAKPVINHATNNTVWLVVNPTTLTSGTTITVTGETAHVEIEKSFTLSSNMEFPAGKMAVLNLTINAVDCTPKASEDYTLVESAGAFEAGSKYVFAFKDGDDDHYEFINNAGTSKTIDNATLTVTAGVISNPASKYTFTAETGSTSGTFNFKNANGNYIYATGGNTTLNTNNASKTDWLPTFISASKTYKIQHTDSDGRYWTYKSGVAMNYAISNFNDQVSGGTALATNDGAISVFKFTDGRSALTTPTGLSVSDMTVSWTAVANAGSYIVTIDGTDYKTGTNSYTFTGDAGYYDVEVVAVPTIAGAETYKNSAAASLDDATFGTPTIATPVLADGGVTASSVTITWTDDAHATNGYLCEIYEGETKLDAKTQNIAAGVESVTFSGLTENTTYTVKVNGKAVTGTYPYAASAVASINMTPRGQHASDVTVSGASYSIQDLTVVAVNGKNAIAADATGAVFLYYSSGHSYVIGDILNISGTSSTYHNVLEFNTPTTTKTGTTTPVYPSPVTYDASKITSYATASVVEYATATGIADSSAKTVTVATGKVLNVYGDLSSVDGKQVIVNGYAFGYNSSKVDFMLVGTPTVDPSVPDLATDPVDGNTLEWDDDKYGVGNAKTITVTLNGAASGYSLDYTDSASAWTVSDDGAGIITAYPKAANESTTTDKTLTLTITHDDDALLTSTITLKQKKQGGGSYTITFSKNTGDGSTASTSTACSDIVSAGSSYLSGNLATATKVYYNGSDGLKLGTSSAAGTVKMNLSAAGQVTATSVVVRAKLYNSGKAATIKLNDSATQSVASSFTDYTFNPGAITYLEIVSSKYIWIESVTVNY